MTKRSERCLGRHVDGKWACLLGAGHEGECQTGNVEPDAVLSRPCPRCGRNPGWSCVTKKGAELFGFHAERYGSAALREQGKGGR